jgi:hypothetical protein
MMTYDQYSEAIKKATVANDPETVLAVLERAYLFHPYIFEDLKKEAAPFLEYCKKIEADYLATAAYPTY